MSSKKTTQTSTQTMTPNNPQWVTDATQGLTGQIMGLSGQDPTSFVAPATPLTLRQYDTGNSLGLNGLDWIQQAVALAQNAAGGYQPVQVGDASHATASTAADYMGNYYNPYTEQVTNTTLTDLDRARQLAQNSNGQGAVLAGQYGGSRQGVVDANINKDYLKQVADTLGQLNYQGFTTAASLGDSDAARATEVSQFNAGQDNSLTALQAQLNQQANSDNASNLLNAAGLIGSLGQYGTGYLGDAAATQQGLAQNLAGAPLSVIQALSGAYGSLPLGLFQGNTTTGTGTGKSSGSLLDTIGKVGQVASNAASLFSDAASLFSDAQLKRDIETVSYDARGRRWVEYRYLWDAVDAPKRRGVIAQEIMNTDPEAVGVHPSGFLMVDYSKLGD